MTEAAPGADGINLPSLQAWLARHLPEAAPPYTARLIAGGHSNLTYLLEDAAGARRVLRRPPLGNVHAGAHDMAREYRIQAALASSDVPVPRMLALCEDAAVIGAPFYVMSWVDGVVLERPEQVAALLPDAASRQAAAESLVDALAALHRVDPAKTGLHASTTAGSYVPRLLRRMLDAWNKTRTRDLPGIEALHARLAAHIPPAGRTALLHCDYRFGNVLLGSATRRVAAVLDWELATLGEPLADLAFLTCNWDQPDDPSPGVWMAEAPTRAGGFPSRAALLERYTQQSGVDASHIEYFRAFAYWRIAIIAEGMKRRYESGAMAARVGAADIEAMDRKVRARLALAGQCMDAAAGQRP